MVSAQTNLAGEMSVRLQVQCPKQNKPQTRISGERVGNRVKGTSNTAPGPLVRGSDSGPVVGEVRFVREKPSEQNNRWELSTPITCSLTRHHSGSVALSKDQQDRSCFWQRRRLRKKR